jgi:hypothetical protein
MKQEITIGQFHFADDRPANPVARIFKRTENVSPSPWGDLSRLGNGERNLAKPKAARPSERARASPRRVEGERYTKLQLRGQVFSKSVGLASL